MSMLTKDFQNLSTAAGNVLQNLLKEGDQPRYSRDEIVRLCCILTTAEYCVETVDQLEAKLKEKSDEAYTDKIDLSDEKDIFHRCISHCIHLMVQDIEWGCEAALIVMNKVNESFLSKQQNLYNFLFTQLDVLEFTIVFNCRLHGIIFRMLAIKVHLLIPLKRISTQPFQLFVTIYPHHENTTHNFVISL